MADTPGPERTVEPLSVEEIRACFPALDRREAGHPVAYFDGPGGTQVPASVADAVRGYLLEHNANTGWAYPSSRETDAVVAGAREAMADLLACRPRDVVFGPNMTTLTFHLARAVGRTLGPGDEVVVTRLDHLANVAPWTDLATERGVTVREVPFRTEDGTLDVDAALEAIGERTRVVAVGWASNALGTVVDVAPILERAREVGAFTFVDGVHAAPHLLPDVRALGCDAFGCSPYKFYGPHAGVLYVRAETLDALDPPRLSCAPQRAPGRLETGTASHEAMAGTRAAVDFLASIGGYRGGVSVSRRAGLGAAYATLHLRGQALGERLQEGLSALRGVQVYGPPARAPRTPTLAFTVEGRAPRKVAEHLSGRHGVFVSHGDFYAANVPNELGVEGLVRAGCACYTTEEEVDRLLEGVEALTRR